MMSKNFKPGDVVVYVGTDTPKLIGRQGVLSCWQPELHPHDIWEVEWEGEGADGLLAAERNLQLVTTPAPARQIVVPDVQPEYDYRDRPKGAAVLHDGSVPFALSLDAQTAEDLETISFWTGNPATVLLQEAVRLYTATICAKHTGRMLSERVLQDEEMTP